MKKMTNKVLGLFVAAFLFMGVSASAQSKWTYAMESGGATYKVHFQQERGTLTIQLYDSKSNKWGFATILEQKPSSGDGGYYKIKAGNGNIYEIWTYASSSSIVVKTSGGQWTYSLESSE